MARRAWQFLPMPMRRALAVTIKYIAYFAVLTGKFGAFNLVLAESGCQTAQTVSQARRVVMQGAQTLANGQVALPVGARTVKIERATLPYINAGLRQVQIGPTHLLMPVAVDSIAAIVGFADAAAGVLLVPAAMAMALWFKRRKDLGLLLMSGSCGL